jgi:hypothetical protein
MTDLWFGRERYKKHCLRCIFIRQTEKVWASARMTVVRSKCTNPITVLAPSEVIDDMHSP